LDNAFKDGKLFARKLSANATVAKDYLDERRITMEKEYSETHACTGFLDSPASQYVFGKIRQKCPVEEETL